MGHNIAGVISAGEFSGLNEYETNAVKLARGYSLVFMDHHYTEHWAHKLGVVGRLELPSVMKDPMLLPYERVIVELLRRTCTADTFAIVWTEYFGGVGDQRGAAYKGTMLLESDGTINGALQRLGVFRGEHQDEFDVLGLQHIRSNPYKTSEAWTKYGAT